MPTDSEHGRDFYIREGGARLRVRMIRTVEPKATETNADFERRMDMAAAGLERMDGIQRVEYDFEWRRGAIVRCTFDIAHLPRPSPIEDDERPAGGRPGGPRGQRGQGNN